MQLPRGTFREIKKGATIEALLSELESSRFSGLCSISSDAGTGTLVFKSGKCILVKFLGKSGDAGCTELQQKRKSEVDAALSTLDDAQIQLSLEFNKTCRLVKVTRPLDEPQKSPQPSREPVKKPAPPVHSAAPAPVVKTPPQKPPASSLFQRPAPPAQPTEVPETKPRPAGPAFHRPAMPAFPATRAPPVSQPKTANADTAGEIADTPVQDSSFEKDIDTFDTMDLENVTDKIRNDCKTMIKQLHLEHLMER
ncbi:MAG: hypothetical protein CVV32_12185 [Methanomicrobiales archaeon HGW-Methanomicrobiales-3]|jgi:hypothetical protein|nr:MAG: hypothetical protein CVV32_12185 [Methanomicrobiales archaeon HGW-Methanomicrobiales-3]